MGRDVHEAKRPWGETSMGRSVHGAKFPWRGAKSSVVVESNEFEFKSESSGWSESKSNSESIGSESKSKSESKSSWLINDLGIYVAREPKNANFEKCNHKNLSTLKTIVTK